MELELRAGALIAGRYRLTAPLGQGGQARVWEALDDRSGALCALKFFGAGIDPRNEVEALLRVQHPHLPRVFDVGEAQGSAFVVLERVAGVPLAAGQPPAVVVRALSEVLGALDALHTAGLLHGDVKPANILLAQERAVLVDLALSRPAGWTAQSSGTLAFLAPECLWGEYGVASELYALGVSAVWTLTGRHPLVDDPSQPNALATALARAPQPRPAVLALLEPALRAELTRWLEPDPHARPTSARAALISLVRNVECAWPAAQRDAVAALRVPPAAVPPLVGRNTLVTRGLEALLAALGGRGTGVVLTGVRGSGRRRAVDELVRLVRRSSLARGAMADVVASAPELISRPTLLVRNDVSVEDLARLAEETERVRAWGPAGTQLALLASSAPLGDAPAPAGLTVLALDALRGEEVRALLEALTGAAVSAEVAARWCAHTRGLAGRLVRAARQLEPAVCATASEGDLVGTQLESESAPPQGLSDAALGLLCALGAAHGERERGLWLGAHAPKGTDGALHELVRRGFLLADSRSLSVTARLDPAGLTPGARARLEAHFTALPASSPPALRARGWLLSAERERALPLLEQCLAASDTAPDERLWAAREALALDPAHGSERRLELARWELALGLADDALRTLEPLPDAGRALVLRADALRRAGRFAEAKELALSLREHAEPAVRAAARVVLCRDALDRYDPSAARAWLAGVGDDGALDATLRARVEESNALVVLMEGGDPRPQLEKALAELALAGDPLAAARLESVAGMAAQAHDDKELACTRFRAAWSLASACGELQAAATYANNLGGAFFERGALGEAARWMERGVRALARLGRMGDLARALCNLGSVLSFVGDGRGALTLATQAERAAHGVGDRTCETLARALHAELLTTADARAQGLEVLWRERHEELGALGPWLGARSALALARAGQPAAARARLEELGPDAPPEAAEGELEVLLREGVDAATLRAKLLRFQEGSPRGADPEQRLRRLGLEVRTLALAGTPTERRAARERYQQYLDALTATLSEPLRPAFAQQHRLDPAVDSTVLPPATTEAPGEQRWRRLAEITRELNTEQRLRPLLQKVMAAVVSLTGASRGLVLLRGPDGVLRVRAAHNLEGSDGEERAFSQSVAERVARSGEPLWTIDAQSDERLSTFESVHSMRLRSILAVPLAVHGQVVGTLYVDDRLRPRAFGEAALEIVTHFAEAAAVALHNARTAALLRRSLRRSERMSRQLGKRLELAALELEVSRSAPPDGVHGRYDEILGRGPAMQRSLRLLDRVAGGAMPVLLQGENGTGKELFARALHRNSPRAARPFVAENCGAIPENLLESVLFGHVRGAFTGADRNRPGLFEVADGGTLFLDEVGEMSPAMQAKLLRVLQDGTFRRVGESQDRKASVRVVAATHRDLPEMVRQGRFREDLFYRLAVMVIVVPPLRQRREDIPALVAHFVRKHGGNERAIERDAMARLLEFSWPGNVRQLENEIVRACALADSCVGLADLSPAVAGTQTVLPAPGAAQNELALDALLGGESLLEGAVARVERAMIERALQTHQGNQTHAARALGMSRFGLQKKLQRLSLDVPPTRRGRPRREA